MDANPPWKIDESDLLAGVSPLEEMREERLRQIREKLAEGVPVTLTCGGRRLYTYYPDGRVINHGD